MFISFIYNTSREACDNTIGKTIEIKYYSELKFELSLAFFT